MSLNQGSRSVEEVSLPGRVKARYQSPVLSAYGNVAALTRQGSTSGIENSSTPGTPCNSSAKSFMSCR